MDVLLCLLSAPVWLISSILIILIGFYFRSRPLNQPPGPKPWPIIGNLNIISSLPHRSIHELSKIYGPIMKLQFGSLPVVVGSSAEMAKQFLKIHDHNLASRPKTAAGIYLSYSYNNMLWAPYGPYWHLTRKLFHTELFHKKRLDDYAYIRVEEFQVLLSNLYSSRGKSMPLRDYLYGLTINNITRMVLGKKLLNEFEFDEFKKMLEEWFFLSGVLNIGDLIPWISFLDLQGYVKQMKAMSKRVDTFLEHHVNEHITRRDVHGRESTPKVMLDVLLELADDPNSDVRLCRNQVKSLTLDLLAAGTETPSTIIEWAMSALIKQPEMFEKATKELDEVIGENRWVEEKDIPNLPYIKSVLYETMRMYPVAPMLAPHSACENCKIHGYDIVKGTQVLVNVWSIGRDPTLWDSPNEFRPDRFIGRDIDINGQYFELLPFGSGRRICPAYHLGRKLIETGLANLIHGFTWKLANHMNYPDLNMEEVWGLSVTKKEPLIVVAEPRLPLHMYSF
ncbi:hypothetical protein ACHQM5_005005 [Ranunculus cassubicifolius]